LARWDAKPGSRAIDSAMLLSGSLPMSSALTDSTTVSEFFFFAVALRNAARKPVTIIVFDVVLVSCALAEVSEGAAGWAAVAALSAPVTAGSASAAIAGLFAITSASGLTAAANRQREDVFIIDNPP
jgi:hypothetical protein